MHLSATILQKQTDEHLITIPPVIESYIYQRANEQLFVNVVALKPDKHQDLSDFDKL